MRRDGGWGLVAWLLLLSRTTTVLRPWRFAAVFGASAYPYLHPIVSEPTPLHLFEFYILHHFVFKLDNFWIYSGIEYLYHCRVMPAQWLGNSSAEIEANTNPQHIERRWICVTLRRRNWWVEQRLNRAIPRPLTMNRVSVALCPFLPALLQEGGWCNFF